MLVIAYLVDESSGLGVSTGGGGIPESTAKVDVSRGISVDISISVTLSASAVISGAGGVGADVLVVGENGGFVGGGVGAEPGLQVRRYVNIGREIRRNVINPR